MSLGSGHAARTLWISLATGILATVVALIFADTRALVGAVILAGTLVPILAILSGNPRLVCLWGLVFFAPLEISKCWLIHKHLGGEYALRLEVCDLFVFPLILFWIRDMSARGDWKIKVPRAAVCWMLLILLTLGAIAFNRWRTPVALEAVRMTKVLLLFLTVSNLVVSQKQLQHVVGVLAIGVVLQSTYGLLQYFVGLNLGMERIGETPLYSQDIGSGLDVETHRRVGALLGHPNIFSCYLAAVLPVLLAALFSDIPIKLKALCGSGLVLGLPALLVTLSRNGWAGFAIGAIIVVLLTRRHEALRRRTGFMRLVVVAVLLVGVLLSSQLIIDRFLRTGATSVTARWMLNGIAIDMALDAPIFGHGKNTMAYTMAATPEYRLKPPFARVEVDRNPASSPPIHNIYLQQWAEQGTVGLVLFVLMIALVVRAGIRNLRIENELLFALNAGFVGGVVAIAIHGLFDWVFWINQIMRVFWVISGCVLAISYMHARGGAAAPSPAAAPAAVGGES